MGFVPGLPAVQLDPDMVFLFLLPPLLYPAALFTSWRDFRANLGQISLLAVGLVLFTTAFVAVLAHTLTGLPWATAFVLGAIISPTDAVAATAITSRLRVPKRIITVLDGESLLNDATALVAYRFAIAAMNSGRFSLSEASGRFLLVALGGTGIGLASTASGIRLSSTASSTRGQGWCRRILARRFVNCGWSGGGSLALSRNRKSTRP
jgi:CPA1 family monovalent cation:H+ antiporter